MKRKALYGLMALSLGVAPAAWAELPRYLIVDLGVLAPPDAGMEKSSQAASINNRNKVVGTSYARASFDQPISFSRAFSYSNGPMKDLGTFDGHNLLGATDINNRGDIVGEYFTDTTQQPFVYKNGSFVDLSPYTNNSKATAVAINNLGESLIGFSDNYKGMVIDRNFNITKIPLLPLDINDKGVVVGIKNVLTRSGQWRTKSYRYDIRTRKIQSIEINNRAEAINDKGHIVGIRKIRNVNGEDSFQAYLHNGTKFTDLGNVAPWKAPEPQAVNELDQVVGSVQTDIAFDEGNRSHAFYYDKKNGPLDLNKLVINGAESGWDFLRHASDINDKGNIVGSGYTRSGELHAFKLVPLGKPQVVSQLVTFKAIPGSRETSNFANWGCSADTVKSVQYKARLTNTSGQALTGLELKVKGLTNVKAVQTSKGALQIGGTFAVGTTDGYSDGKLAKNESVVVPITVCLTNQDPFKAKFDVLAAKEVNTYALNR